MRTVLFFAIAALALAGLMPKFMSSVGSAPAPQAAQTRNAAAPAPQAGSNYRTVTVRSDARGHFQVEGAVDGRRLDFMVDTGATSVVLRERDAARLGIFPAARDYTGRTSTANGVIKVAPVRLSSLEVNGIRIYDVGAIVVPDDSLGVNLLGMSFLGRVRRFEMANGRLVMEQ
jgi:aspartyl protease family protein